MGEQAAGDNSLGMRARQLDLELVRVARSELQLKLRMGECLDALFERRGHHEMGFSSIEAYVVERCQRSRAWGRDARGLARNIRVKGLAGLRRAVLDGGIGWSMAELIARRATRETEGALLEEASRKTLHEMQRSAGSNASGASVGSGGSGAETAPAAEERKVTALRRVTTGERVELAASRMLVEYLNGARPDEETFISALLGEGFTALQSLAEGRGGGEPALAAGVDVELLEATLRAMRASRRTPKRPPSLAAPPVLVEVAPELPLPDTDRGLDEELRRCTRELARRNLRLGRLFGSFLACRGWLALGYESAAHYAAERLGLSVSSLQHRVTLARIAGRYPDVGDALDAGEIGYEAALMIGRVLGRGAGRDLARAWVERAKRRTVRFLRDECDAVLTVAAMDSTTPRTPPTEEDLEAYVDFERSVQSGELLRAMAAAREAEPRAAPSQEAPAGSEPRRLGSPADTGPAAPSAAPPPSPRQRLDDSANAEAAPSQEPVALDDAPAVPAPVPSQEPGVPAPVPLQEPLAADDAPGVVAPVPSQEPVALADAPAVAAPVPSQEPVALDDALPAPVPSQESVALPDAGAAKPMARPLRMTFSPELYLHWREVETLFHALVGPRASFLDFLCTSLWQAWLPFLEIWDDKWKDLYRRDRCRCSSPVCERRDLTPHHDGYPPPGQPDDPEKMATLCEFCHLRGIHEGRIEISGKASARTWLIGRNPILMVKGRDKQDLAVA